MIPESGLVQVVGETITRQTLTAWRCTAAQPVSGGCIHRSYVLHGECGRSFFLKTNHAEKIDILREEMRSLSALSLAAKIRVPKPIAVDVIEGDSYLLMEYLPLANRRSDREYSTLGRQLAELHLIPRGQTHGWDANNHIGMTKQVNDRKHDWSAFFIENRLLYQLRLAQQKGVRFPEEDGFLRICEDVLSARQPRPALLHGDLWAGNAGFLETGEPVIFDPASYEGDPETDLAMTELFGGFPDAFYRGYHKTIARDPGYPTRRTIYNTYHILNHFNLFGGGYCAQARSMMAGLMS